MSDDTGSGFAVVLAMIALLIIAGAHAFGALPYEDAVVWSLVNIGTIVANR